MLLHIVLFHSFCGWVVFHCNGNPLQCSCLENPRDGVAWWAAVSGVAQSRTRLKRLSSSSSSSSSISLHVYVYIYHIFFIHSSASGHLGCFHVLAAINSAAMNIGVHVSFWIKVFSGYMPRSGVAGWYGFLSPCPTHTTGCPVPSLHC